MTMRKIIVVVAVIFAILFFSVNSVLYNQELYLAYQGGVDVADKALVNEALIGYFLNQGDLPSVFVGTEGEHMQDVKDLVNGFSFVFWILFFLAVYFGVNLKDIFWGAVSVLLILIVLELLPFDRLFVGFHEVFFTQGTWTFPEGSFITTLYTFQFFSDMFCSLVYRIIGVCLVLLVGCKTAMIRLKYK